jgi:hypothetical protein
MYICTRCHSVAALPDPTVLPDSQTSALHITLHVVSEGQVSHSEMNVVQKQNVQHCRRFPTLNSRHAAMYVRVYSMHACMHMQYSAAKKQNTLPGGTQRPFGR